MAYTNVVQIYLFKIQTFDLDDAGGTASGFIYLYWFEMDLITFE